MTDNPVPAEAKTRQAMAVSALLAMMGGGSYLEIGVHRGLTFRSVSAGRKVGVDPNFLFDTAAAQAADPTATFHWMTSDAYFGGVVSPGETFDVILIDGLHTFDQTLRDFCNACDHLAPGGAIVIDDVMPSDREAALPTQEMAMAARRARDPSKGNNAWMGDVYRLFFLIEACFQQWRYAAVAPHGNQLVVWREPRRTTSSRHLGEIAALTFDDAVANRAAYRQRSLNRIVEKVRAAREPARIDAAG